MSKETTRTRISKNKKAILEGDLLAIDPSSGSLGSRAGWARFHKGILVDSGTFNSVRQKDDIYSRLRQLSRELNTEPFWGVDVLAIEMLRSKAHTYLRWSCVPPILATSCPVLEIAPMVWHSYAPIGYQKSDEGDAIQIGLTVIAIARGTHGAQTDSGADTRTHSRAGRKTRVAGGGTRKQRTYRRTRGGTSRIHKRTRGGAVK